MRILYSHFLDDDDHPAVQMVHAISRQLRSIGHEVCVHRSLGEATGGHREVAKPTRRTPLTAVKDRFWFARALARNRPMMRRDRAAIEAFRPDVVLAREDPYCVSMALAAGAAGVPLVTFADVPVAYETRTFPVGGRWHPPFLVEAIERLWLKRCRAVVTPCRPAADELKKYGLEVPIHVSANGVDPENFPETTPEQREQGRRALGLPEGATIVGFQGSFRRFHGIDLLRDMILATASRPDVHWLLIGDGPERGRLEAAVAGRSRATFIGKQPPGRMGALTAAFDIAVSTHVFVDGSFYFCPLKILEYGAAGCAILASTQGDIPRLLDGGRAGVLVDGPDPAAWIAALVGLLANRRRAEHLGRAAREFVLGHLTWKHSAIRIESILNAALAMPMPAPIGLVLSP